MIKKLFPLFLLPIIITIFFHDVVFLGKTLSTASLLPETTPAGPYGFSGHRPPMPFSFDTGGNAWVNEPNPYIIKIGLKGGQLPAWNPHEGLGMPLIANLNNEVFNSLKLFLNLFPDPFSQDMFYLLRLLVMGLFTYLFLREKKLGYLSSLLGSSFFMLSGYSVWWINLHPLSTVMYLPAVFYFYERWSERKDSKSPFLMSLSLSCAFVAGKIPDVIMGLFLLFPYALWKGVIQDSLKGAWKEGVKVVIATVSGALMAAAALLPFFELYSRASPLAKAIRTGASGHTIPLISSVTILQPLFLGWRNYFYGSWLKWTPDVMMPHAGIVIMLLSLYALLHRKTLTRTIPFSVFSLFLFSVIYGLFPSYVLTALPVLGSIEFLKYNAMLYFSLAVLAASAFDDLLSVGENRKQFYLSLFILSAVIMLFFFTFLRNTPPQLKGYLIAVLLSSLAGISCIGISFHLSKKRKIFGVVVFMFLILELFIYMPKDHPDRTDSYKEPPYLGAIKEKYPYRFTGGGSSMPPLVSNAMGLYDIRAISVLLPRDYYIFFENLLSFSVPQTNNPNPLFSATSPFIDLMGVKYILSQKPLEYWRLEDVIRSHITSLRWVRLFDAMIEHSIKGGATYGFFNSNGEERFSFYFPMRFRLETRLKATEPFIFAGLTMKDVPKGTIDKINIRVENRVTEVILREGVWEDRWVDVSQYLGKVIRVSTEGTGRGSGSIVLGNFGLSPGYEKEMVLYEKLLMLHKQEIPFLVYRGACEGIHIYENRNVMNRAFILHRVKILTSLDDVIKELQDGIDFRKVGLVTDVTPETAGDIHELFSKTEDNMFPRPEESITIRKYASDEIAMEVESAGGLLVLSDLYYPGWKVRVNGREKKMIKAFGLLRGVLIHSGKNEVLFSYRPTSLYLGIIISAATFIAWMLYLWYRRKKAVNAVEPAGFSKLRL